MPLLAPLDIAVDDERWTPLDPVQKRQRTLDACKRLTLCEAQVQPLVLMFEDLHWIDSETQALLDGLVDSLPTARPLLLVNYREEYSHTWGNKSSYTQLRIDPLGRATAQEMLDALLGADPTVQPLKPLLIGRTDGNLVFVEEGVRALVETGALVGERVPIGSSAPLRGAKGGPFGCSVRSPRAAIRPTSTRPKPAIATPWRSSMS